MNNVVIDFFLCFILQNLKNKNKTGSIYDRYDGIMLPPDEGNKNSGSWNLIKNAFTKLVSYFDENLYKKYFISTIEAMLYELRQSSTSEHYKLGSLRDTLVYLEGLYNNLNSFYGLYKSSLIDELKKVFFSAFFFFNN